MQAIGFDNDKYLRMQSEKIRERISQFGGKLYLEFGGKLFDDYHASRVLPGFAPDSKVRMLMEMKDDAEIIIAISADDIERNKRRGDLGITYDDDTLRLIDAFQGCGLYVGSVVITHHRGQPAAEKFQRRLEALGIRVYRHYIIPDYPSDIARIVSDDGFGRNDYIETTRSLIVVTAPGPGSGKMATCLSQLYHEHKRGVCAGYAKFETFPIWNLPLRHPVNLAYEAATVDLDDVNMIDPFHLEAYGVTTVNYNRDVEIFPVLNAMFQRIYGSSPYKSPTDMGVNMAGYAIVDDEAVRAAAHDDVAHAVHGVRSVRVVVRIQHRRQAGVLAEHLLRLLLELRRNEHRVKIAQERQAVRRLEAVGARLRRGDSGNGEGVRGDVRVCTGVGIGHKRSARGAARGDGVRGVGPAHAVAAVVAAVGVPGVGEHAQQVQIHRQGRAVAELRANLLRLAHLVDLRRLVADGDGERVLDRRDHGLEAALHAAGVQVASVVFGHLAVAAGAGQLVVDALGVHLAHDGRELVEAVGIRKVERFADKLVVIGLPVSKIVRHFLFPP